MSTSTQQERRWNLGSSDAQVKNNILVTGRFQSLSEPKRTGEGNGDYYMSQIVITPTRSTKEVKASFMFRPEMLATKNNIDIRQDVYGPGKGLDFIPDSQEKKTNPMTQGQVFKFIMDKNVRPDTYVATKDSAKTGVKAGETVIKIQSTLSAIVGGTGEAWLNWESMLLDLNDNIPAERTSAELGPDFDLGVVYPLPEESVALINSILASGVQPEQVIELKQQRRNGNLTDFYEVAKYHGLLTTNLVTYLKTLVEKKKGNPMGQRLAFTFSV